MPKNWGGGSEPKGINITFFNPSPFYWALSHKLWINLVSVSDSIIKFSILSRTFILQTAKEKINIYRKIIFSSADLCKCSRQCYFLSDFWPTLPDGAHGEFVTYVEKKQMPSFLATVNLVEHTGWPWQGRSPRFWPPHSRFSLTSPQKEAKPGSEDRMGTSSFAFHKSWHTSEL